MASRIALARRQRDFDLAVEDEPQLLERVEVQRVADDHLQRAIVFFGHRQDGVFARDRLGHQFDDRGGDDDLVQVDVVEPMLFRGRSQDLFGRGVAEHDERVGQFFARGFRHAFGFGELIGADDSLADEDFGEIRFLCGHYSSIAGWGERITRIMPCEYNSTSTMAACLMRRVRRSSVCRSAAMFRSRGFSIEKPEQRAAEARESVEIGSQEKW